jgi:dTDP-4-amino-4,6-dideoxygalactose transaminase
VPIAFSGPSLGADDLGRPRRRGIGQIGGRATTQACEETVRPYLGCKHVGAVTIGTSALHTALSAFGIGSGDELAVASITLR